MKERGKGLKRNVHVWAVLCSCDDFIPYSIQLIIQRTTVNRSFILKQFFTHFSQLLSRGSHDRPNSCHTSVPLLEKLRGLKPVSSWFQRMQNFLRGEGLKPDTAEVQMERNMRQGSAAGLVTILHMQHMYRVSLHRPSLRSVPKCFKQCPCQDTPVEHKGFTA